MSLFKGIAKAKATQGGVYIVPGNYLFEIQACKEGRTRKGDGFFVAELKVIETDNSDRPVGSICSWMAMDAHDSFLNNVKAFVCGVTGSEDNEEIDEETLDTIVGEKQPLAGTQVKCQATNVKTRAGGDFTRCNWFAA